MGLLFPFASLPSLPSSSYSPSSCLPLFAMEPTKKRVNTTVYTEFDPTDVSWWEYREMGSPDDPYNQIPVLEEGSEQYNEYLSIAQNSFDQLLEEANNDDGWVLTRVDEEKGVKIESKYLEDDPIRRFRGSGIINTTAEVLRLHLVQLDLRQYWDPMFLGGHYVCQVTPSIRVVYYSFQTPAPFIVANRDFVAVAGETMMEDGTCISAAQSIEIDEEPEKEGMVRGLLKSSGFVIKPLENDENGSPRCHVTYLAQINAMGWIPTWVSNLVNGDQPLCVDAIRQAISLTEIMLQDALTELFELEDEQWNATTIRKILLKVVDRHNGKKEMLLDPVQYVLTGSRKPDKKVEDVMEEKGKPLCMKLAWDAFLPYCQSIAKPELYALADKLPQES